MVEISGGDGLTKASAIKITDCDNDEGVQTEYRIIKERYGKYHLLQQSLLQKGNRLYDKLIFKTEDGKEVKLFFDITDFFGEGI